MSRSQSILINGRNQAIAEFVQWAKATPNVLSQAPADGLTGYLVSKFPCKRAK